MIDRRRGQAAMCNAALLHTASSMVYVVKCCKPQTESNKQLKALNKWSQATTILGVLSTR